MQTNTDKGGKWVRKMLKTDDLGVWRLKMLKVYYKIH